MSISLNATPLHLSNYFATRFKASIKLYYNIIKINAKRAIGGIAFGGIWVSAHPTKFI